MDQHYLPEKDIFKQKTGIDVEKYVTQESLDKFEENFEDSVSFVFNMLIPVIILNIIFIAASVGVWFIYKSILYSVIFFIVSLIVSVLGGGLFGIGSAVKKTVKGVSEIVKYTNDIFKDLYPEIGKEKGAVSPSASEVYGLISAAIVLPVIAHILKSKLLGGFIYKPIEKAVLKSSDFVKGAIDKFSSDKTQQSNSSSSLSKVNSTVSGISGVLSPVMPKVSEISSAAVKGIVLITKVLGILSMIVGAILLTVLLIVLSNIN